MPPYNTSHIFKLLATQELRSLPFELKVYKLVTEHHVPYCALESVLGITKSSIERLVKAMREGRTPRLRGRPRMLSSEEEGLLVKALDEADARQAALGVE